MLGGITYEAVPRVQLHSVSNQRCPTMAGNCSTMHSKK